MRNRFIILSLLLFAAQTLPCLALPSDEEAQAPDSIARSEFSLDDFVVTGTCVPKLLKDAPVQTRLITRKDIERSDASNIDDLLQQELPSAEFSYAMNQQVHMNIGGFGGQSVLFLVDGERLAGETMDDVDFSRIPMRDVERIEIVRGASSALYGSNAAGGVVNIITRRARHPWQVTAEARIGKHLNQRYGFGVSASGKRVANTLSASYQSIKNYNVSSDPDPVGRVVSTIYGHRTLNVADRFSYAPVDGLDLSARAGYFFRQIPRSIDSPERYRDYSAGLRADWHPNASNAFQLSYSFDQYDKSTYFKLPHLDVRDYSNVQNSVRAFYAHTFANGDILSAGADCLHDYLLNSKFVGRHRSQTNVDAFLQYDWTPSQKWEVVGALRYDWFSDGSISRVTPKISARYQPIDALNIRASYGMGFRAPTLKEKYYEFDMAGIWIVTGNPSLRPETSHNANLSADYTVKNYNFTLAGYYNHVRDKISSGLPYARPGDPTQLYLEYVNLDRYNVYGFEAAVQGVWNGGFSARLSYAYTHESVSRDKQGNQANNQYMPARPHSLSARFAWIHEFSKNYTFDVSLQGRALSGVKNREYRDYYNLAAGTVEVNYPAYSLWKIQVAQTFASRVKLILTVDNLFNYRPSHYYLNSPLTDGISLLAGVSIDLH